LYNDKDKVFASYDDPESLELKSKYVLEHKLRGIMFWDYESDPSGALLDAIKDSLDKSPHSQGRLQ